MKELSIEEKAKAYDEALKVLHKYDGANIMFTQDLKEKMFPELRESEDERIRKELIFYLGDMPEDTELRNGVTNRDVLVWLEKQGKNNMSISEATKQELEDNLNKALEKETPESCNEFLEKQGEQKPADKVEPKFKVKKGEWYVCTDTFVSRGKIIAIKGQTYQSKQEDNTITCEDNCLFIDRHDGKASDYFRPWTIQDAKDGDVLFHSDSASNGIFIFKEIIDKGFAKEVICYCDYDSEDHFCLGEHHTCCWADAKILHPATKDQRDTLMKAMADAGYTFNFEKKELKKLGQSEVTKMSDQEEIAEIPFGAKDSELQEVTYYIPKGFHAEIDDDKVVIKKGEKPATWSEEDELSCFESALFTAFSDAWQS